MLTAYDATFAAVADAAGVDCILVGDSLGMVCQGLPAPWASRSTPWPTTPPAWPVACSACKAPHWLVADLPYGTYAESREQTPAQRLHADAGRRHMVKLEGGGWTAPTVEFLVQRGVPVCAHLGLTPQTVHALGGYRVQGKTDEAARTCAKTPTICKTPVPPCWCWRWCPPPGRRADGRAAPLPHHRHWRGQRHRRPGAGVCTTCWA